MNDFQQVSIVTALKSTSQYSSSVFTRATILTSKWVGEMVLGKVPLSNINQEPIILTQVSSDLSQILQERLRMFPENIP
jgi:hypothetical protein